MHEPHGLVAARGDLDELHFGDVEGQRVLAGASDDLKARGGVGLGEDRQGAVERGPVEHEVVVLQPLHLAPDPIFAAIHDAVELVIRPVAGRGLVEVVAHGRAELQARFTQGHRSGP